MAERETVNAHMVGTAYWAIVRKMMPLRHPDPITEVVGIHQNSEGQRFKVSVTVAKLPKAKN